MKKISVLIVLFILIFSCNSKTTTVEKKFDVLKNVSFPSNNLTSLNIETNKDNFVVNSNGEIPQFTIGDSLTGRFTNNQLQFVKDNKGVWLPVSRK